MATKRGMSKLMQNVWKSRYKLCLASLGFLVFLYIMGVLDWFSQLDYFGEFTYPVEADIARYVSQLKAGEPPDLAPINSYDYPFKIGAEDKCKEAGWQSKYQDVRILLVIKSALKNQAQRDAIRQTWGWEKRFSDVTIKRVFILGIDPKDDGSMQKSIEEEHEKYLDIVQANFVDSYYNNTIKTLVGFRWVVKHCPATQYIFFSDDDMYVSVKNILKFVRNPYHYPDYLERNIDLSRMNKGVGPGGDEFSEAHLFAGYVFFSQPLRHRFSKWYVSLQEYPYSKFPPYVTAGAYVASFEAVLDMYYASFYTKHFRFDDVFLGLVAKKARITPIHNENFHFWKKPYDRQGYKYVVASHGYGDTNELLRVWNEQRSSGNA